MLEHKHDVLGTTTCKTSLLQRALHLSQTAKELQRVGTCVLRGSPATMYKDDSRKLTTSFSDTCERQTPAFTSYLAQAVTCGGFPVALTHALSPYLEKLLGASSFDSFCKKRERVWQRLWLVTPVVESFSSWQRDPNSVLAKPVGTTVATFVYQVRVRRI